MKVLIVGGAGFIGFSLAKYIASHGAEVHISDIVPTDKHDQELRTFLETHDNCLFVGNFESEANRKQLGTSYSHVIHLAALLGVQNVIDNSYDTLSININLTMLAIEFAKSQKSLSQLIFASTSEVYAGSQLSGNLMIPTPETAKIILPAIEQPRTSYALSKICGEALCLHSNLPVTIIRPHNIYGPRMGYRHVIPQLLQRAFRTSEDQLDVNSCEHTRTFCYIDDAVEMVWRLMNNSHAVGKTLNLGNASPEITIHALAEIVIKTIGKELIVNPTEATDGSPKRRCPNVENLKKLTSYDSKIDIYEGVNRMFKWYRPML